MSLLRRPVLGSRVFFRGFSTKLGDEEFRTLEIARGGSVSLSRRKHEKKSIPAPTEERYKKMPVNQDWPSVWPVAASFKYSVVPLPVRQGYHARGQAPPGKYANHELMKIPNFLHLTPPAIERHCEVLKKFCTKWPEELTPERSANWVTITTSDYVHAGPSIRDERARIVSIRLRLSALDLDKHAKDKLIRLAGPRYNPKTDELVIVTDRCPMRHQNLDYSMYALTALFHESWITEEWELTEIQETDLREFQFKDSRSEKFMESYVERAKDVPKDAQVVYGDAMSRVKNEGDNEANMDEYKKAVLKLMKLPSSTTASTSVN